MINKDEGYKTVDLSTFDTIKNYGLEIDDHVVLKKRVDVKNLKSMTVNYIETSNSHSRLKIGDYGLYLGYNCFKPWRNHIEELYDLDDIPDLPNSNLSAPYITGASGSKNTSLYTYQKPGATAEEIQIHDNLYKNNYYIFYSFNNYYMFNEEATHGNFARPTGENIFYNKYKADVTYTGVSNEYTIDRVYKSNGSVYTLTDLENEIFNNKTNYYYRDVNNVRLYYKRSTGSTIQNKKVIELTLLDILNNSLFKTTTSSTDFFVNYEILFDTKLFSYFLYDGVVKYDDGTPEGILYPLQRKIFFNDLIDIQNIEIRQRNYSRRELLKKLKKTIQDPSLDDLTLTNEQIFLQNFIEDIKVEVSNTNIYFKNNFEVAKYIYSKLKSKIINISFTNYMLPDDYNNNLVKIYTFPLVGYDADNNMANKILGYREFILPANYNNLNTITNQEEYFYNNYKQYTFIVNYALSDITNKNIKFNIGRGIENAKIVQFSSTEFFRLDYNKNIIMKSKFLYNKDLLTYNENDYSFMFTFPILTTTENRYGWINQFLTNTIYYNTETNLSEIHIEFYDGEGEKILYSDYQEWNIQLLIK